MILENVVGSRMSMKKLFSCISLYSYNYPLNLNEGRLLVCVGVYMQISPTYLFSLHSEESRY